MRGISFFGSVAKNFVDHVFDRSAKKVINASFPPVAEGVSAERFRNSWSKVKFLTPFLKFFLGVSTLPF